jgi:hypothetical protein
MCKRSMCMVECYRKLLSFGLHIEVVTFGSISSKLRSGDTMIKLVNVYKAQSYDMMIDRAVKVNITKSGICRDLPIKMDEELRFINTLSKRIKRDV